VKSWLPIALAVLIILPSQAAAQGALRSIRAAKAMPASYSEPACELSGSHYKTNAAARNLQSALGAERADNRVRELEKGRKLVVEAIEQDKQGKSSAAWFLLARIYLYEGDLTGADSALRHAAAITPDCAGTFEGLRYQVWAPLINAGVEFVKAEAHDSALALFREAAAIDPRQPQPLLAGGVILANRGETDSAIAWFSRAAGAAEGADVPDQRNQATFNLAAMLQRAGRHAEAAAALERYIRWSPKEVEAKRALATSYRALGRTQDAERLEGEVIAVAGADTSSAVDTKQLVYDRAMRTGVEHYNAKRWKEAAAAFREAVTAAPHSRDAIFALANAQLAMKDTDGLVRSAELLFGMDPMNEDVLGLLAAGYQRSRQPKRSAETATRLLGLGTSIAVERLAVESDGASLSGKATGRAAQTADGKPISAKPVRVLFEFLDQGGAVVDSQAVEIPALKAGETHTLSLRAAGKGIVGWRYRGQ
jgi:tetratricopeptide (TPR) repeat protein